MQRVNSVTRTREIGTVKWFNNTKGYGFVTHPVRGDVFVYYHDIVSEGFRTLRPAQQVEFNLLEKNHTLTDNDVVLEGRQEKAVA